MPNRLNGEFSGSGIYSILKLVPVGIVILESSTGKITYANDRAVELYGINPLGFAFRSHSKKMKLLRPNGELYPSKLLPANRALKGEKIFQEEVIIERFDGSRILVSSTAAPLTGSNGTIIGSVAIFEDITEKRELEKKLDAHVIQLENLVSKQVEQLKNAERLSAIGQTAGMIGHDIRNPLQSIFNETFMLKSEVNFLPESNAKSTLLESINSIEESLSYIEKIVQDLQDYAKPPKPTVQQVAVDKIIQEVLSTMNIPETVHVSFLLEDNSLLLKADPIYIKRILTNLISNSIQALEKGGKITIKVERRRNKALLSVEDTGQGIPAEVRDKIFTPLVSTKPKGQGFGLAVVKKLTEALDGTVTFESELGKGTRFNIELPID